MKKMLNFLAVLLIVNSLALFGADTLPVTIHVIDDDNTELDFTASPYDNIVFKVYNLDHPEDVITQDTGTCGYDMLGGIYSTLYIDFQYFVYPWEVGDTFYIQVDDLSRPYMIPGTYWGDSRTFTVVDTNPVQLGFEPMLPGSGAPMQIMLPSGIDNSHIPEEVKLSQNYPNPFNPETQICFSMQKQGHVKLSVFNSEGQLVKELLNDVVSAGEHSIDFSGKNLISGIYFYTLETDNISLHNKMMLIK